MDTISTSDVLDFDHITVHIDLAPNDQASDKTAILKDHQHFLKQCMQLSPNGKISLHIHKAPAPYESVMSWFQTVFANGTAAAAFLGASLLSTVTGDLGDHSEIRSVAATGAVLFVMLFLLCSGCTLLFAFSGGGIARIAAAKGGSSLAVRGLLSTLSIALQALPIAGVCCLFWVLEDYVSGAGQTGFGITLALGAVVAIVWGKQTFFGG